MSLDVGPSSHLPEADQYNLPSYGSHGVLQRFDDVNDGSDDVDDLDEPSEYQNEYPELEDDTTDLVGLQMLEAHSEVNDQHGMHTRTT